MAKYRKTKRHDLDKLLQRDHNLHGAVLYGLDGYMVEIQARAMEVLDGPSPWGMITKITGMPRGVVIEAVDRISGAFAKLQIPQPEVSILINLTPPDLPKDGTWLDLPLAIIMLQASGYLPDMPENLEEGFILAGEVGLHGDIRRIPGALSLAFSAQPGQKLIVPRGNEKECALILAKAGHEGCKVYPVSTLQEVIQVFSGNGTLENALKLGIEFESVIPQCVDFGRIRGQEKAKEAALITAAGGHNLLMIGPPGEGKSLLASAIPGILPRLTNQEKVELTRIYSACGKLEHDGMAITRRPMRSVHPSASKQALVGGGSFPKPGEITLAHHGILFLDEFPEFSSDALESLRQPLESGEVTITRVRASMSFPCRFTLVAAMNPCPCGYFGTDQCRCKDAEVIRYQQRISGPILDRIDLHVELLRLSTDERFSDSAIDESAKMRAKVENARDRQRHRFGDKGISCNAAIPGGYVKDYCQFSQQGFDHYKQLIDHNSLTTRSVDRLAKVARTVADLIESDTVEPVHVDKAASYVVGGMLREAFC
jgi:magnesium chelatase family protein